jgi:phage repressor protein C with HTH and peptisase S24 domain
MNLADRIKLAIRQSDKTKKALASAVGVSPSAVTQWTNGSTKSFEGENLVKVARFLEVSPDWLATGKGEMKATKSATNVDEHSDFKAIKRVKFKLSAGISGYEIEYLNGHRAPIFFRRDWLEARSLNADNLFAVEVSGASMETSLFEGDMVVVNTADTTPRDGYVFAANYDGELVIKRLFRNEGEWFLSSDNQDKRRYPDKRCDERTFLLGVVVHKQSERI